MLWCMLWWVFVCASCLALVQRSPHQYANKVEKDWPLLEAMWQWLCIHLLMRAVIRMHDVKQENRLTMSNDESAISTWMLALLSGIFSNSGSFMTGQSLGDWEASLGLSTIVHGPSVAIVDVLWLHHLLDLMWMGHNAKQCCSLTWNLSNSVSNISLELLWIITQPWRTVGMKREYTC